MEDRLKQVRSATTPELLVPSGATMARRAGAGGVHELASQVCCGPRESITSIGRVTRTTRARCADDSVDAYRNAHLLIMATCDRAMARAAFERTRRRCSFEAALQDLLDWVSSVRRQDPGHG